MLRLRLFLYKLEKIFTIFVNYKLIAIFAETNEIWS